MGFKRDGEQCNIIVAEQNRGVIYKNSAKIISLPSTVWTNTKMTTTPTIANSQYGMDHNIPLEVDFWVKSQADMVGSAVKGKASASKSICEALTLVSGHSEPLKSSVEEEAADSPVVGEGDKYKIRNKVEMSMDGQKTDEDVCGPVINGNEAMEQAVDEGHDEERDTVNEIEVNRVDCAPISVQALEEEAADSLLVGEGEKNKIRNKVEMYMDGQKTDEDVCGLVIVNGNEAKEQAVDEGHDEERYTVNEIEVNRVDCIPTSVQTLGYTEEVTNGGSVANTEKLSTQEVSVKDNETVVYELNIKDVNNREERNSLDVITDNMVDGDGLVYAEEVNVGGGVTNTMKGNETVIFGVDIKDVNPGEERKSSEVVINNLIDGGGLASAEQVNGVGGIAKVRETTPQELALKDNDIVICGLEITDVKTREERASLDVVKDGMIDGGLAASVHQRTDNIMIDNLPNEKEADELNVEVPVTILENGKRESGKEDASAAHIINTTPGNFNRPKRKRLNRKVFEKQMFPDNNEASVNEAKALSSVRNGVCHKANEADSNEHVKNDEKAEAKRLVDFGRKLKRVRKKEVLEGHAGVITANDEQECKPTDDKPQNEDDKKTDGDDQDLNNEEAEERGDRINQFQRTKDRKVEKEHSIEVAFKHGKSSKGADCSGMIFMCSSETKEDCYRYRVLGLPSGKKNMVLKIYKGMRLFMFDFNLKVMYGIYKAAGPGGYNIEPRAFGSQFPSQVRFTVIEDCVPLAEEKFRSVIRDNYYTKNKFNCQLTREQVKNLCKLFHETTKKAKTKLVLRSRIVTAPSVIHKDRKRRRVKDSLRAGPISSLGLESSQIPSVARARHYPMVVSEMHEDHPINEHRAIYEREIYAQSRMPAPLYQPLPTQNTPRSPSFLYSGAPMNDMCRMDLAPEHCELSLCECGQDHELDHGDPYVSYAETYAFQEPAYNIGAVDAYQEPEYETRVTQGCRDRYPDTCQFEYYRRAEYQPPFPPYRMY